jgi:hypothetical protein
LEKSFITPLLKKMEDTLQQRKNAVPYDFNPVKANKETASKLYDN